VFCADGGQGIWPRTEQPINELNLVNAVQVLDYTHTKQNLSIVKKLIADTLKLSDKESRKLSRQMRDLLWSGDIDGITGLVKQRLLEKEQQRRPH